MHRVLILVVAGTVAACAPMAYQRPQTSLAQTETDQRDCRAMAQREAFPAFGFGFRLHARRHRRFGDPLLDRMQGENQLADFRMRARGYTLEPVPRPAP